MTARELFTVLLRLAGIVLVLGAATDVVAIVALGDEFPFEGWMWFHPGIRGAAGVLFLIWARPIARAFHRDEVTATPSIVTNVDLQRFGLLLLAGYAVIVALKPLASVIAKCLSPLGSRTTLWRAVRENVVEVAVYAAAVTLLLVRRRHLASLVQRLRYEPKTAEQAESKPDA